MNILITVKGAVQGIGYRPFIAGIAVKYNIRGRVKNIGAAVEIFACGSASDLQRFEEYLRSECPPGGFILSVDVKRTESISGVSSYSEKEPQEFEIVKSKESDLSSEIPVFLPDIGICSDCLKELLDRNNRRYRHPLISCAVCGPRLSILDNLPYDRENTKMKAFKMCPECSEEYQNGRRRYAQTISCHDCGPQMILLEKGSDGRLCRLQGDTSVNRCAALLKEGKIIGLKGVSGYQLVCLPREDAARRIRSIKGRENKPFAVMFADMAKIKEYAQVNEVEEELLESSARPIVLLKKIKSFPEEVDKKSRYVGAFLPSAGIHRLLCDEAGPLIVTSANRSGCPIITDDKAFLESFFTSGKSELQGGSVDAVLYHERDVTMPQDDSVMFTVTTGQGISSHMIRRSRGFAPLPVIVPGSNPELLETGAVLAFGGDLKSSFSFARNNRILPSQYIGDLEDYSVNELYQRLLNDYKRLFSQKPSLYVKDMHPGYYSGQLADSLSKKDGIKCISLQHHFAHTYSVMAENGLTDCIGVSFDGTGYGLDGNIWGGEFILVKGVRPLRSGHLSYIKLLGGDNASKDAQLVKECYLYDAINRGLLAESEIADSERGSIIRAGLKNDIGTFASSSMGRLFDGVSALLEICSENSYEGECASLLEKCAAIFPDEHPEEDCPFYSFDITETDSGYTADQTKLFADIYRDTLLEKTKVEIAFGFHMAIVRLIADMCERLRDKWGESRVCLSGGVFNNRIILAKSTEELTSRNFEVFSNRLLPLGDGGISAGQAYYGLLLSKEITASR